MAASKGYSINVHVPESRRAQVIDLLTYLTSVEAQSRMATELGILPSNRAAYDDPAIAEDPTLQASREAFDLGRRMPVVPEMRVLWDVMRPGLQNVKNGAKPPAQAAKDLQAAAVQQIASMKR
jgi:maltose-binding protein MalE